MRETITTQQQAATIIRNLSRTTKSSFCLSSLPEIFADGYHPAEKTFTVNEGVITNLSIQLIPLGFVSSHEQVGKELSNKLTNAEDADHRVSLTTSREHEKDHLLVSQSVSQASVSRPDPHSLSMSPITVHALAPETTNNNSLCLHVFKFNFLSLIWLLVLVVQMPPFPFPLKS